MQDNGDTLITEDESVSRSTRLEGDYHRRVMRCEEIEEAFKLLEDENWNLTLTNSNVYLTCFHPAFLSQSRKRRRKLLVAMGSAIPTFANQFIVGNLVVRKDFRSQGLGNAMMLHILGNTQQHSGVFTLTAVPGTNTFYSKLGFHEVGPFHHVNFVEVDKPGLQKARKKYNTNQVVVLNYAPSMFDALNDYDTQARGYECEKYLSVMIDASDKLLLARDGKSGSILGDAAGVEEPSHLLVDGLYADNDGIALELYCSLLDAYPDQEIVKIQEIKPRDFLTQFGNLLPKSHSCTRMATSLKAFAPNLSKLYCVSDCDYSE